MMGYRIEFLTDVNDRPETHLKDKIVRIPEQIGNLFPNAKIQTEVPIESLLCDFVVEIPTDEFMSVFGNDSLTTVQKKLSNQTYLLEIHGPAHYCTVTGEIDLKTSHKLETWRQLGWHIGYLTSTELSATAKLHVDTTAELKKILQARLKWTMKDGPHAIKLEV